MATTTVRITEETHTALRELAATSGRSLQEVLAEAVDAYRRTRLLEQTNEAYGRLRADAGAWQEEIDERAVWEATLADGLVER